MQKIKKSVSGVVTTAILIAITVVAASILFASVNKMLKKQESMKILCLDITPPVLLSNACFNSTAGEVKIDMAKISEKQIESLEFILEFEEETLVWCCSCNNCQTCSIIEEGSKVYYISSEKKPKTLALRIDECAFESKKVADC